MAKTGAGNLNLTGAQPFTGPAAVTGGTLTLDTANALAAAAAVTVDAVLQTGGHDQTLRALAGASPAGVILLSDNNTLTVATSDTTHTTYAGHITGDGSLALTGGGALTLSASQRYTGNTAIAGGTLTLGAENALASSPSVAVDGALVSATNQVVRNLSGATPTAAVELTGTLTALNDAATTFAGGITGAAGLLKTGAAALTLSGSSAHTGATRVASGELVLGAGGTTGSILALTDTTKNVTIDAGAALVFNRGDTVTYTGANITGSGAVIQRGGGELLFDGPAAQQQWTGGAVVESGTMKVAHTAAVGGTITIGSGGAFVFGETSEDGAYGNNYTISQAIAGGGVLAIDISEESAAVDAPATITFGGGTMAAAAHGQNFHGAVELRHTTYAVNPVMQAFLNAGTSTLRTADGSLGSLAANSGSAWRIDGDVEFAGGVFQWDFDATNAPLAWLDASGIAITAPTQFRLNLPDQLQVNTSGSQQLLSLFDTLSDTADQVLLGRSDTPLSGAMNQAELKYSTNNGTSWHDLTDPARQGVMQGGAETARAVFDWAVYDGGADAHEMRVGYKLARLEILKDAVLQVVLSAGDPTNAFSVEMTDYAYAASDDAGYAAKAGSGGVFLHDLTGTTGIRLTATNSYTGTTTIGGSTAVTLGHDAALGSAERHTVLVSATEAGALLRLTDGADARTASVGGLDIAGGEVIDLGDGGVLNIIDNDPAQPGVTATAAGGGTVSGNGALTGTGALNLGFGDLAIHGANPHLSATGSIAPGATLTLDNVAGLGLTGTLTADGALVFAGATGTHANALAGAGLVSATSAANVILTGTNTAFTGTWQIAPAAALKATGSASLGAGKVDNSGTLTLGAPASLPASDWQLATGNLLTGGGVLVKEDANTITLSHSNSYDGGSVITAGVLAAHAAGALGSGTVTAQAGAVVEFDLFAGMIDNPLAGTGTARIGDGARVELTGTNSIASWVIAGGGTARAQDHLGDGAVRLDAGGNLTLTATAWRFTNALAGTGTLTAALAPATGTFSFAPGAAGADAFTGALALQSGFLQLDATAAGATAATGTGVLREAALVLGADGVALLDSGTYHLGGLTFGGGLLKIEMKDATAPLGALTVGDLRATAHSAVALDNWNKVGADMPDGTDFFWQDSGTVFQALVTATGNVYQAGAQMDLYDFDGTPISDANRKQIRENGGVSGTATYDYGAQVVDSGTRHGLYLAYMLRELSADSGTSVTLDSAGTLDPNVGLTARLTGGGGFVFTGTGVYYIGNDTSDYTGTSAVTGGTLMLDANNGFGRTARLTLAQNTEVSLYAFTQTIGAFTGAAGSTLDFAAGSTLVITGGDGGSVSAGVLTGAGALTVQSNTLTVHNANPGLRVSGTIETGAALVLDHVQALGAGALTADGALVLDAATGAFANPLAGAGLVSATNAASIILTGTNTAFTGTW
ncbi:MAG: autotransporter-associated beta strand repeat-containing protein, partial [Opitutaceae bacterium]|nr:autotransporter-associated beta strand repeat-containing protein [Opitutaceae bacterium]